MSTVPRWLELELLAWMQGRTGVLSIRWKDGQAVSIDRQESLHRDVLERELPQAPA